jgi:predicted DNA binding protein
MLKINTTSIIKNLPIWEVEYSDLPNDDVIKGLRYQEIDFKRQFYIWGDETGDNIIKTLQLKNIKDELINHDVNNLESMVIMVRDLSTYSLPPHYDNNRVYGVIIINTTNNKNSTVFYNENDEIIYINSSEKGKGIFFLNTSKTKHSYINDTNENRYAVICTLHFKS